MRGLRKPRLLLLVALAIAWGARARAEDLPRVRPEAAGFSAAGLERLDDRFRKAIEDRHIPGAVILLTRKGKVGHLRALGMADVEAGREVKPDTVFRLMSMTKAVTSVAAMMLVEEGKLRLDDPVSKYLPEFKNQEVLSPGKATDEDDVETEPAKREVTVRDLLRHTSGLIYPGSDKRLTPLYNKAKINPGFTKTSEALADNIKRLGKLPLAHQPGARFTYGLSTDVLGRVVEVVAGKTLSEFFHERIFTPLGMKDATFHPSKEQVKRLAVLYRDRAVEGKKLERVSPREPGEEGSATYFSGGAGLYGTADDYTRFLLMLQRGGRSNGVRLLKAETVRQMTENQLGELTVDFGGVHGDAFGLGFGVVTPRSKGKTAMSVGAYSWAGAYYTYYWVDPSKELTGVMMTQVQANDDRRLWKDLVKLTYAALTD
jgi:CubicO group peptidase (beta-lactamase class C family)